MRLRVRTYSTSSASRSGQSTVLRPFTCASPVIPGTDLEPLVLVADEAIPVVHRQRPGTDERDLAAQQVEQRRQLVEAGRPQPAADPGDPLGIELRAFPTRRRMPHRAELQQFERLTAESEAALAIDHPGPHRHPGGDRRTGEHRREHDQTADCGDHVDRASDAVGESSIITV